MGAIFWATATAIFAVLEVVIPTLVTIWLALASLIVIGISFVIKNPFIEFLLFSILSLIFVLFTRPFFQKYLSKDKNSFDSQMIGTEIKIEKIVDLKGKNKEYEVRFKGAIWTGISDEEFQKDEIVVIKNFIGNKIVLEKKED